MNPKLYDEVIEWIPEGSRVLDLGSGDGDFLERLTRGKNVHGEGVEKDPEQVARCIERGLVVHQGDIMDGLDQYGTSSFDYVLLLGTFEELTDPIASLEEAFRVGRRLIISYHNFGYWRVPVQLLFYGRSPVTRAMPHEWFNSPTVHYFTILDFYNFCVRMKLRQVKNAYFNAERQVGIFPRLRAEYGLCMLEQLA